MLFLIYNESGDFMISYLQNHYPIIKPVFPIDSNLYRRKPLNFLLPYKNSCLRVTQLLTTDSTLCSYRSLNPLDNDIWYITLYTTNTISCIEIGKERANWYINLDNKEQYDNVINLINQFPSDWNLRFASHKNFWLDYLKDTIDIDSFMAFIESTNKGIPDFSTNCKNDIIKWSKYFNPPNIF